MDHFSGKEGGIGITTQNAPSGILVESVLPNSPASQAGMRINDVITQINGNSLADLSFDKKILRIRGLEDTSVTVTVARAGEQPLLFNLIRIRVLLPNASAQLVNDHTILLTLRSFTNDLPDLIQSSLSPLYKKNMDLIVDLRDNSGGDVYAAFTWLQSIFADETPVILQESRNKAYPPVIYGSAGKSPY